jgi:hypothetical protein
MAIYRLSAKLVKRSEGQSVIASAAYRAGIVMSDMRTGQLHDYTRRRGVVYAEVLAPPDTPDWMLDRIQLWNAVEVVEKRKDAQLARELQLALPHELTPEQRLELVLGFARSAFVAQGMIADVVVHQPDRRGDERNHHAHVLLTLRSITGDGFGPKARAWNDTALLEGWRSDWSDATNRALAQHGHTERVDHRSYADRGIDREPEPKMGPVATTMERNGHVSHAGDDRRSAQARNQRRAESAWYTCTNSISKRDRPGSEQISCARGSRGLGHTKLGPVGRGGNTTDVVWGTLVAYCLPFHVNVVLDRPATRSK